jgi:hypothetical protein
MDHTLDGVPREEGGDAARVTYDTRVKEGDTATRRVRMRHGETSVDEAKRSQRRTSNARIGVRMNTM